ncbi:amidase [Nibricoccus aquaticus]|uniref:Amidase n=1 Tax=Nibricoccus aquaticus TaxID=2576891 RepID=A0A290QKB4_9BACT|nr:amidase family protein [Nibricoccus aquaticus]ATC64781.1 amidase [Nibricoccus aquaticus]
MLRSFRFCLLASGLWLLPQLQLRAAQFDLSTATVADINAAFESGALTSEKLTQLYLARIEAYDKAGPKINAVITLNTEALATARALDAERKTKGPRSPLHGVPVVLKDLYDTKDMPTSAGFLPLKNSQPTLDATVVKRLREAGAIILAKVNMDDWFGVPKPGDQSTVLGRTLNPYNAELTPGGSSGGTGASVAAVFAQLGLGSETGVSIRNPTSNNSIVGLAPTRGLIPRAGQVMTSFTQERCGPMARSVYDVAALTDIVAGFDAEDLLTITAPGRMPKGSYTQFLEKDGLKGARIGVLRDLFRKGDKHVEGTALIETAITDMKASGAIVLDDLSLGYDVFKFLDSHGGMRTNFHEAQFSYDLYFRRLGPNAVIKNMDDLVAFGDLVKPSIRKGYAEFRSLTHHADYLARRDMQESLSAQLVALMDKYKLDALVYPFKTLPPEPHLEKGLAGKDNAVSSITGLPALIVPTGYTKKENGPIAMEILGRPWSEPVLFRLGYAYEQATHRRQHPAMVPALSGEKFTY